MSSSNITLSINPPDFVEEIPIIGEKGISGKISELFSILQPVTIPREQEFSTTVHQLLRERHQAIARFVKIMASEIVLFDDSVLSLGTWTQSQTESSTTLELAGKEDFDSYRDAIEKLWEKFETMKSGEVSEQSQAILNDANATYLKSIKRVALESYGLTDFVPNESLSVFDFPFDFAPHGFVGGKAIYLPDLSVMILLKAQSSESSHRVHLADTIGSIRARSGGFGNSNELKLWAYCQYPGRFVPFRESFGPLPSATKGQARISQVRQSVGMNLVSRFFQLDLWERLALPVRERLLAASVASTETLVAQGHIPTQDSLERLLDDLRDVAAELRPPLAEPREFDNEQIAKLEAKINQIGKSASKLGIEQVGEYLTSQSGVVSMWEGVEAAKTAVNRIKAIYHCDFFDESIRFAPTLELAGHFKALVSLVEKIIGPQLGESGPIGKRWSESLRLECEYSGASWKGLKSRFFSCWLTLAREDGSGSSAANQGVTIIWRESQTQVELAALMEKFLRDIGADGLIDNQQSNQEFVETQKQLATSPDNKWMERLFQLGKMVIELRNFIEHGLEDDEHLIQDQVVIQNGNCEELTAGTQGESFWFLSGPGRCVKTVPSHPEALGFIAIGDLETTFPRAAFRLGLDRFSLGLLIRITAALLTACDRRFGPLGV